MSLKFLKGGSSSHSGMYSTMKFEKRSIRNKISKNHYFKGSPSPIKIRAT